MFGGSRSKASEIPEGSVEKLHVLRAQGLPPAHVGFTAYKPVGADPVDGYVWVALLSRLACSRASGMSGLWKLGTPCVHTCNYVIYVYDGHAFYDFVS